MKLKKFSTFILILVLVGLTSFSLLDSVLISGCLQNIKTGTDGTQYFLMDIYEDRSLTALGIKNGDYVIRTGALDNNKGKKFNLSGSDLPGKFEPAGLFALSEYETLLPVYSMESGNEYGSLTLFYINLDEKSCSPVRTFDCSGETAVERRESIKFSSFSSFGDTAAFAVYINGKNELYSFNSAEKSLVVTNSIDCEAPADSLVFSDGSSVYINGDSLIFTNESYPSVKTEGALFTRLNQAAGGFYCYDSASANLMYFNLESKTFKTCFTFAPHLDVYGREIAGRDDAVCWSLDLSGNVFLLDSAGHLSSISNDISTDISPILYRAKWQSALTVALLAVAVIVLSYAIYYSFSEAKKMKLPLLLRKGLVLAAIIVIGLNGVINYALIPGYATQTRDYASSTLGTAALLASENTDGKLSKQLLQPAGDALGQVNYCVFGVKDGSFVVTQSGTTDIPIGSRCTDPVLNTMFGEGLLLAQQAGSSFTTGYYEGKQIYRSFSAHGSGNIFVLSSDARSAVSAANERCAEISDIIIVSAAVLWMVVMLMFAGIVKGILRLAKGMDSLAASGYSVEVVQRSGDELEGIARSFNDMTRQVRKAIDMTGNRNKAYLRFVPQQIITLLGKTSVEDVDKQTFVSRKMATMMVWFGFGEDVYASRTKDLFDNINRIIEKTAAIVSQNGGTVYNFTYDGYDAVFADDPELAISTAVAIRQEVTSLNKERAKNGESPVAFRIALDDGEVMMGIVGDESRMVPTAISSSLNTAKRLVSLCSRLDANILCTQNIAPSAKDYNIRYVGKSRDGDEMIRVYEIFDGDTYSVRLAKESSVQRFSEGILTFYSRDFSAAKRIFIDIARQNSDDGAAKFYLYLSDKFEREAPADLSLDY